MLAYLLLLSALTAQGINNSLRTESQGELAAESASENVSLEGIEDDSSKPILTESASWFCWLNPLEKYCNTSPGYDYYNKDNYYATIEYDLYGKWGDYKDAKKGYFACGFG
jgi:hypothetical protein